MSCSGRLGSGRREAGWLAIGLVAWPGLAESASFSSECSAGRPAGTRGPHAA
jgi:hypothetical protein